MFGAGDRLDNAMRMADDIERSRKAERELLVRALRALEHMNSEFVVHGDEHGPNVGNVLAAQHAESILSDPLAVELLKEADRG